MNVWIYNSNTGTVMLVPQALSIIELKSGLGWHGPFASKEAAIAFYNKGKAKNTGWKAPTGYLDSLGNIPGAYGDKAEDAIDAVGDAAKEKLGLSNDEITTWMIRIGEILLGIVLVGVGIAKLTGTTNTVARLVKAKL